MEGEVITLQDLFTFDYSAGRDEAGRFRGQLVSTGLRPKFTQDLADLGRGAAADAVHQRGAMTGCRSRRAWRGRGWPSLRRLRSAFAVAAPPARRGRGRAGIAERHPGDGDRRHGDPGHPRRRGALAVDPASVKATVGGKAVAGQRRRRRPSRPRSHDARHRHERVDGRLGHGDGARRRSRSSSTACRRTSRSAWCRSPTPRVSTWRRRRTAPTVQREVASLRRPTARPPSTQGCRTPSKALGTKGERSIVLLSDGGDTVAEIEGGGGASAVTAQGGPERPDARRKVRAEVVAFKSPESNGTVARAVRRGRGRLGRRAPATAQAVRRGLHCRGARPRVAGPCSTSSVPPGVDRGPGASWSTGTAGGAVLRGRAVNVDLGDTRPTSAATTTDRRRRRPPRSPPARRGSARVADAARSRRSLIADARAVPPRGRLPRRRCSGRGARSGSAPSSQYGFGRLRADASTRPVRHRDQRAARSRSATGSWRAVSPRPRRWSCIDRADLPVARRASGSSCGSSPCSSRWQLGFLAAPLAPDRRAGRRARRRARPAAVGPALPGPSAGPRKFEAILPDVLMLVATPR